VEFEYPLEEITGFDEDGVVAWVELCCTLDKMIGLGDEDGVVAWVEFEYPLEEITRFDEDGVVAWVEFDDENIILT